MMLDCQTKMTETGKGFYVQVVGACDTTRKLSANSPYQNLEVLLAAPRGASFTIIVCNHSLIANHSISLFKCISDCNPTTYIMQGGVYVPCASFGRFSGGLLRVQMHQAVMHHKLAVSCHAVRCNKGTLNHSQDLHLIPTCA